MPKHPTKATVVIVSMGRDVHTPQGTRYDEDPRRHAVEGARDTYCGTTALAIAEELQKALSFFEHGMIVYGASASVWGYYDADVYDEIAETTIDLLQWKGVKNCTDGSIQLVGAQTTDSMGYLHIDALPQLCSAIIYWCKEALSSQAPRARL